MVVRVLELEVDGPDVIVAWPPGLSGTDYTVNYRVVSQDGHPVSGSLSFTVDAPPPTAASAAHLVGAPQRGRRRPGRHPPRPPPAEPGVKAPPSAAIAAGLGVGIAVGFLFWIMRRRGGAGAPEAPPPEPRPMTTATRPTDDRRRHRPDRPHRRGARRARARGHRGRDSCSPAGPTRRRSPGLPDPGATVGWGTPVVRLLSDLAAVATVGWLLAADLPGSRRARTASSRRAGRRDLRRAAIAAAGWAVLALVQLFLELANVLGLPSPRRVSPNIVSTYANEIPTTRALLFMTLLATVVCIGAVMTATTGSAAAWLLVAVAAAALPALAGHSSGLGDHALATTAGVAHVVAAVVWMGGLVALGVHAARRDLPLLRPVQRFSTIALVSIVLLAASGAANAYTRLDNAGQLFTTGYGQVLVTKTLLIVTLGILGWVIRGADHRHARPFLARGRVRARRRPRAPGHGGRRGPRRGPRVQPATARRGAAADLRREPAGLPLPASPTAAAVGLGFSLDPLFLTGVADRSRPLHRGRCAARPPRRPLAAGCAPPPGSPASPSSSGARTPGSRCTRRCRSACTCSST